MLQDIDKGIPCEVDYINGVVRRFGKKIQCSDAIQVEFPADSNLQIIGASSFAYSGIRSFFIPSKMSKLFDKSFNNYRNLQIIEISEESKLESFLFQDFSTCQSCIIMIPASLNKFKL